MFYKKIRKTEKSHETLDRAMPRWRHHVKRWRHQEINYTVVCGWKDCGKSPEEFWKYVMVQELRTVADPGGATGGHGPPNDGQIFFHT